MRDQKFLNYIAKKAKELREEKGISQADFYNDTGIHIGRIEGGERDISASTIKALCDYFEITVSEFFKGLK